MVTVLLSRRLMHSSISSSNTTSKIFSRRIQSSIKSYNKNNNSNRMMTKKNYNIDKVTSLSYTRTFFSSIATRTSYLDDNDDKISLLIREDFLKHGYKFGNINPLNNYTSNSGGGCGFIINDISSIQNSLPKRMKKLVPLIHNYRQNINDTNDTTYTIDPLIVDQLYFEYYGNNNSINEDKGKEIIRNCLLNYCSDGTGIGYEIDHCYTEKERNFFEQHIFNNMDTNNGNILLQDAYEQLLRIENFTNLMSKRYSTAKRFGIEGLETSIILLNTIIHLFGNYNDDKSITDSFYNKNNEHRRVLLCTQHRGRLDFLYNVLKLPLKKLINKWDVTDGPTYDDICYGYHSDVTTTSNCGSNDDNKNGVVHISMIPIPAHLEAMDAVVAGKAHAHIKMRYKNMMKRNGKSKHSNNNDDESNKLLGLQKATNDVLPITIHGDSSICGQGIVFEAVQINTYRDYNCGGTIRIILNNQIGYTTEINDIRGGGNKEEKKYYYQVSDISKSVGSPILHVNSQNLLDVIKAAYIAYEYRQKFHKDIFINFWGYRLNGHNELDDPNITNVKLYQIIKNKMSTYNEPKLGSSSNNEVFCNIKEERKQKIQERIQNEFNSVKKNPRGKSWREGDDNSNSSDIGVNGNNTSGIGAVKPRLLRPKKVLKNTSIDINLYQQAVNQLIHIPKNFNLHPQVQRIINSREKALVLLPSNDNNITNNNTDVIANATNRIDWATSELLALITLSIQGVYVRLSGEDVQRGTFSQRHAVYHDIVNGNVHYPLSPSELVGKEDDDNICVTRSNAGDVEVCNSPLSELGVLGFEYGISITNPSNTLILWEAQFGDFVNGAQTLIDTVFTASEEKWLMQSNLTLLLPHGYDGMGPEHSSSRIERFLQLYSSDHHSITTTDDNNDSNKYESSNIIIAYPTEPSNYFHLLRRQLTWNFRRPLVILTPKRTLRMSQATSKISEFITCDDTDATTTTDNSKFRPVIDDPRIENRKKSSKTNDESSGSSLSRSDIKAIILCSGEIYYDICKLRQKIDNNDDNNGGIKSQQQSQQEESKYLPEEIAVIRIEEIAPFPVEELKSILLNKYTNASSIAWVQEEPLNQGPCDFVTKHLQRDVLAVDYSSSSDAKKEKRISIISRPEAAAPAVGHPKEHAESQQKLFHDILHWSYKL